MWHKIRYMYVLSPSILYLEEAEVPSCQKSKRGKSSTLLLTICTAVSSQTSPDQSSPISATHSPSPPFLPSSMSSSSKAEESVPRSMREIVQKRFSEEVIGNAATSGSGWMVLVMDDDATRVISSALTMYDIMEQRVTLVEQLAKSRQPFKEMDVVYLVSPTVESANLISADFENDKKSKYGGVHVYFLDLVSD